MQLHPAARHRGRHGGRHLLGNGASERTHRHGNPNACSTTATSVAARASDYPLWDGGHQRCRAASVHYVRRNPTAGCPAGADIRA